MCIAVNIRFEEYDIYIGRAGKDIVDAPFGNPHLVGRLCPLCNVIHKRGEAVPLFFDWFYSEKGKFMRDLVKQKIKKGMKLGCFCKPKNCHGDIIAEYVNNGYCKPADKIEDQRDPWEF